MATNNRKQSLINQMNRCKVQIKTKKGDILKLKRKPNSGNNNSYQNSIASLEKQIQDLETQIERLKSEIDKL